MKLNHDDNPGWCDLNREHPMSDEVCVFSDLETCVVGRRVLDYFDHGSKKYTLLYSPGGAYIDKRGEWQCDEWLIARIEPTHFMRLPFVG